MRGWLYDRALLATTAGWYRAVLERLPRGARLLDVGIGTGGALATNAGLVRERGLLVVGVDPDAGYLARCRRTLEEAGLAGVATLHAVSIHDFAGGPFDAVYFSGSFMLIPEPVRALERARGLLAPGGRIYFTQTFEQRRSRLLEWAKPRLRWLVGIDFGRVTYEAEFRETLGRGGLEILEEATLRENGRRSARVVVAATRTAV